jgi:protease-4
MKTTTMRSCIASLIVVGLTGYAGAAEGQRIAHVELSGPLLEAPAADPFGLNASKVSTTKSLIERLKQMRDDETVAAVFMTFENPGLGLAQIQEIRQAVEQLKAVEKEVYIHMDSCSSSAMYWLASCGTRVAMVPTGDLWLTGLYGEQLYLKDMLGKLGVAADVIHIGDFKSAGETFSRNAPSPPAAQQIDWLFDSLFDQLVSEVAQSRGIDAARAKTLIDQGPYTAESAKDAGLIDEIAYRMDFVSWIKARHGDIPFDKNYGSDDAPTFDLSNPFAFFEVFNDLLMSNDESSKPKVALIYVSGVIITGKGADGLFGSSSNGASSTLRKALYRAARDDKIKAVVLRVDSPGGSATASEIIWHASQEIVASGKPFIASMGNTAASGGYYVSCGADTIFAEPGTITGSIGVVGMKFVTKEMWDWLGVHWHPVQRGANANMMASDKPFTDHGRDRMTSWMNEVYGVFKDRILQTRKDRLTKPLDEIAGGRVYTGAQAKALGLVDQLGGLQDALKYAALEANLGNNYDVRILPKPKTLMDLLMEGMGFEAEAAVAAGMDHAVMKVLRELEPQKAAAMQRMLDVAKVAQQDKVMLTMPMEIVIR